LETKTVSEKPQNVVWWFSLDAFLFSHIPDVYISFIKKCIGLIDILLGFIKDRHCFFH
jgi:hypothetical protein